MAFADLLQKKFGTSAGEEVSELQPLKTSGLEGFIQKFAHVSEEYSFYDNTITIRFNKEDHEYFRVADLGNLVKVNGVTNTVGIIDKSFMLTPWASKMAIQKMLRLIPTEMVDGVIRIKPLTFEEFTIIAMEAKTAHKDKLDEAADIGHLAHKCLEDSINYAMTNDPDKIVRTLVNLPTDEQALNAANAAKSWMDQHNVRWQETETKIYSREHDYAGTMDGLAVCDACTDNACCPEQFKDRLSLIDWKSSNHLKIEYLFQVASYKHAKHEEHPDMHIYDTWILRLGKNEEEAGKFEPWHMSEDEDPVDFAGFLACLELTRLVDNVEDRMSRKKTNIRAIKKEQRESAKALAKEQAKLQKAIEKAAKKLAREEEKKHIKAEAKAERERLKAEKKLGKLMPVTTAIAKMLDVDIGQEEPCTSSEPVTKTNTSTTTLDTTPPQEPSGFQNKCSLPVSTKVPEPLQESLSTTSTEATNNPALAHSAFLSSPVIAFETEVPQPTFKLPMENE